MMIGNISAYAADAKNPELSDPPDTFERFLGEFFETEQINSEAEAQSRDERIRRIEAIVIAIKGLKPIIAASRRKMTWKKTVEKVKGFVRQPKETDVTPEEAAQNLLSREVANYITAAFFADNLYIRAMCRRMISDPSFPLPNVFPEEVIHILNSIANNTPLSEADLDYLEENRIPFEFEFFYNKLSISEIGGKVGYHPTLRETAADSLEAIGKHQELPPLPNFFSKEAIEILLRIKASYPISEMELRYLEASRIPGFRKRYRDRIRYSISDYHTRNKRFIEYDLDVRVAVTDALSVITKYMVAQYNNKVAEYIHFRNRGVAADVLSTIGGGLDAERVVSLMENYNDPDIKKAATDALEAFHKYRSEFLAMENRPNSYEDPKVIKALQAVLIAISKASEYTVWDAREGFEAEDVINDFVSSWDWGHRGKSTPPESMSSDIMHWEIKRTLVHLKNDFVDEAPALAKAATDALESIRKHHDAALTKDERLIIPYEENSDVVKTIQAVSAAFSEFLEAEKEKERTLTEHSDAGACKSSYN